MFHTSIVKRGIELVSRFPYKIGIVVFMAFPELIKSDEGAAERIKTLAEDPFFDLLEISHISDAEWSRAVDYLKKLERPVDIALGMQPEILIRGYNPSSPNEEERKKAEQRLVELTRIACSRKMKAVALCSGPTVPEAEREKAIESTKKTLRALAEEASKCGIPVYLETFDVVWDRKRLLGNLPLASKVIEDVRATHPNVYILWDLSHAPMLGESPEDLRHYADLIGHIHIGCAKKIGDKFYDTHPGFYRPGAVNDERDVAKLLAVLSDMKYRGAISFEVKPEEGQEPLEVINAAKSVLVRAYQLYLDSYLGR